MSNKIKQTYNRGATMGLIAAIGIMITSNMFQIWYIDIPIGLMVGLLVFKVGEKVFVHKND